MNNKDQLISKTQYVQGIQCRKMLHLEKHQPELKDEQSDKRKSEIETGNKVGQLATELFPNGVRVQYSYDLSEMAAETQSLIESGVTTIYEATFVSGGAYAILDILDLNIKAGSWDFYEVKSTASIKEHHIDDVSLQNHVVGGVLPINKAHVIHINTSYEREGELDVKALFAIEDVTKLLDNSNVVASKIAKMKEALALPKACGAIGDHCDEPYKCGFKGYCWSHVPETSVFNLYRLKKQTKWELYDKKIISYKDLKDEIALTPTQDRQVRCALHDRNHVDVTEIAKFMKGLVFPISHFDFETMMNVIPRFNKQRPYQQIAFQYSLHIEEESGEVTHKEFLADEKIDPRFALVKQMLHDLPKTGTILAFNMAFEKARIKELAILFPQYRDELLALNERFMDLIVPFRKGGLYLPAFNGSFSLKSILPAMFPNDAELDYKGLTIQNGEMAMEIFAKLHLQGDPKIVAQIRKDLLAYCQLDTFAMVKILAALRAYLEPVAVSSVEAEAA